MVAARKIYDKVKPYSSMTPKIAWDGDLTSYTPHHSNTVGTDRSTLMALTRSLTVDSTLNYGDYGIVRKGPQQWISLQYPHAALVKLHTLDRYHSNEVAL